MREDITCALGGVNLHGLDSRIYVEDIKETVNDKMETATRAGYGTFPLTEPERDSLVITVTCFVKEKSRAAREAVYQKIRGWATKGWFTKSTLPGQRIYVYCTKPPDTETFENARLEIEFTAYGEAYWQDATPVEVASSSAVTSASVVIHPNGTKDCFLEAEIKPSGGTLTDVSISVGSQLIELAGLSTASGTILLISYNALHVLQIKSGSTSVLKRRTPASSDEIILEAGADNTVELAFNTACTYKIKARSLWR